MGEMWNERRVKDNAKVLGSDNWKKEAHTSTQKTKGAIHLFLTLQQCMSLLSAWGTIYLCPCQWGVKCREYKFDLFLKLI